MKTATLKSIAIIAISAFTMSLYAQNTKSVKIYAENTYERTENTDILYSLNKELSFQLKKLAEICKFNPGNDIHEYAITYRIDDLSGIPTELAGVAKFIPEVVLGSSANEDVDLDEIRDVLQVQLKFNPSESMVSPENENLEILSEVLNELSIDIKYKPTNIQ